MSTAEKITRLQQRLTVAETAHARAVGARDNAQETYDRAIAALHRDFSVDTIEQGQQQLEFLNARIQELADDINTRLDEINARKLADDITRLDEIDA